MQNGVWLFIFAPKEHEMARYMVANSLTAKNIGGQLQNDISGPIFKSLRSQSQSL